MVKAQENFSRLFDVLSNSDLISNIDLPEYFNRSQVAGVSFIHYLVDNNIIAAEKIARVLSQTLQIPYVNLNTIDLNQVPLHWLSYRDMHDLQVMPLQQADQSLQCAMADPCRQDVLQKLQFITGLNIQPIIVDLDQLRSAINTLSLHASQMDLKALSVKQAAEKTPAETFVNETLSSVTEEAVVRFVDYLLKQAISKQVSDIHFESYADQFRVRMRIDGLLSEISKPPPDLARQIITRLKLLAQVDIAERRLPQDGQFQYVLQGNHVVDIRISTCPVINGEKLVLRILDGLQQGFTLADLGMGEKNKTLFQKALELPQGMILVTGPTGSGKTMTLYAGLKYLNQTTVNIASVEDPVEIRFSGINQVQVNPKIGLNFSTVLRSFLRQDPDIIMIGEMRDSETANIAFKAAETGHLVLSTLHTNNTFETIARLQHLGIAKYQVTNSVNLVIAQRLLRRLCTYCKTEIESEAAVPTNDSIANGSQSLLYQANGCDHCHYGYQGRMGIFELLAMDQAWRDYFNTDFHCKTQTFQALATAKEMLDLYQDGLQKVHHGLTTHAELKRVVGEPNVWN